MDWFPIIFIDLSGEIFFYKSGHIREKICWNANRGIGNILKLLLMNVDEPKKHHEIYMKSISSIKKCEWILLVVIFLNRIKMLVIWKLKKSA